MGLPIIGDLIDGVKDLVSEVVVDKDKKAQIEYDLIRLADEAQARLDAHVAAQIEVNKVEAASGSVFVAGWRPAIGWVGAASLAYAYIIQPFIGIWHPAPKFDFDGLIYILTGMLGIGAMRSFEKVKGVSTNDYSDTPSAPPAKVDAKPKKRWKL